MFFQNFFSWKKRESDEIFENKSCVKIDLSKLFIIQQKNLVTLRENLRHKRELSTSL